MVGSHAAQAAATAKSEAAGQVCGARGACEAALGWRNRQSGAVKDRHSDCRSQENSCCRLHVFICGFIFTLTSQLSLHMDLAEKHLSEVPVARQAHLLSEAEASSRWPW